MVKLIKALPHLAYKGNPFSYFMAWAFAAIFLGSGFSVIDLFTTKCDLSNKRIGIATCIILALLALCIFSLMNLRTFSKMHHNNSSKLTIAINVLVMMFTCLVTTAFFTGTSALTPFNSIDTALHQADLSIGFNQNYWVELIYSAPLLHKTLQAIYFSLYFQLGILPLVAIFFVRAEKIYEYFGRLMMLGITGTAIYYLFPTTAPTIFLNKDHLIFDQINLVSQFNQIHSGQIPEQITIALIGFPSFHVIWSLLLCSLFRGTKLFTPIMIYNFIVCLSTILLGWHYLMDVLASCALVTLALLLNNKSLITEFQQDLQLIEEEITSFKQQREHLFQASNSQNLFYNNGDAA